MVVISPSIARGSSHRRLSPRPIILTMGPHHYERAEALGGVGRTHMLTAFAGGAPRPVSDPFGGDLDVYRATYAELEREIAAILDKVAQHRAS
jgi:protein-tyrosine-phosphatase